MMTCVAMWRSILLDRIEELLQHDQCQLYTDVRLVCNDGTVLWSKFLLAGASSLLQQHHAQLDGDAVILIPDVSVDEASFLLKCSIDPLIRKLSMSARQIEILKLLGFDFAPYLEVAKSADAAAEHSCHCGMTFARRRFLERHRASHDAAGRSPGFSCDTCGKEFHHPDNLKLHQLYHNDVARRIGCPQCGRHLAGRRAFRQHMQTEHEPKQKCPECQLTTTQRLLKRHMQRKHPSHCEPSSKALCRICGRQFRSAQALMVHQRGCHGSSSLRTGQAAVPATATATPQPIEARPACRCTRCDKSFRTGSRLRRHLREAHGENRFECNECGLFFPVRHSLQRHLRNVHHPVRHDCPFCGISVIHLAAHLISAHQLASADANAIQAARAGKSSARTDLTLDLIALSKVSRRTKSTG